MKNVDDSTDNVQAASNEQTLEDIVHSTYEISLSLVFTYSSLKPYLIQITGQLIQLEEALAGCSDDWRSFIEKIPLGMIVLDFETLKNYLWIIKLLSIFLDPSTWRIDDLTHCSRDEQFSENVAQGMCILLSEINIFRSIKPICRLFFRF